MTASRTAPQTWQSSPVVPASAVRPTPAWLLIGAWALAALTLLQLFFFLFAYLNAPILDFHAFRQAQTALSTYWLTRGGPFFGYWTPMVGFPWSVPFELPIFQGIVAVVSRAGLPLDAAGRLVSVAFLLLCAWPMRMLWRDLRLPPLALPIAFALVLASPEYLFWSRTFLMETCALCLGLLWLALFVRFLHTDRPILALAALFVGVLAILAKATTFPAFAVLGAIMALPRGWRVVRQRRNLGFVAFAAAALLVPFAVGFAWVAWTDAVKEANPIGHTITSSALAGFNYGSLEQRLGPVWAVLQARIMTDMFGRLWMLALLVIAAGLWSRSARPVLLALAVAFMVPLLVFTDLHIVHNYYQCANAAFLLVATAIALAVIATDLRQTLIATSLVALLLASQAYQFYGRQYKWLAADTRTDPVYQIALAARERIAENGGLVGIGDQWSSVLPYYAQRKAMMVSGWLPAGLVASVLRDPAAHLGDSGFAGVVQCDKWMKDYEPDVRPIIDAFLANRRVIASVEGCRLLSPTTGGS